MLISSHNLDCFIPSFRDIQFSSVAQSCLTLCDPTDCSTPGVPVHHQLRSLLRLMSMESVTSSNRLILFCPLLLLLSVFPSRDIRGSHLWPCRGVCCVNCFPPGCPHCWLKLLWSPEWVTYTCFQLPQFCFCPPRSQIFCCCWFLS